MTITAEAIKFQTDTELTYTIFQGIPEVARVRILGDTVSVEYKHNMWRDEFTTVDQIVAELQKQHIA